MARRRWEKVSVGSLTQVEREQLVGSLAVVRPVDLRVSIADVQADVDATEASVASVTLSLAGKQNTLAEQPAITNPTGGATVDTEARTAINSILTALRTLGLIDT